MTRATMTQPKLTTDDGKTYGMDLGVIERTMLGWEAHGLFTFVLYLDFGVSSRGAGLLALGSTPEKVHASSLPLIMKVMQTVGVEEWEALKGKRVYALLPRPGDYVRGLANITDPEGNHLIFETFLEGYK
jgi:hypothetical protein